jgi:tripartite-type tricarboxylate transporter receptor subunit TctC
LTERPTGHAEALLIFAPAPVPSAGRRSKIQTYVDWGDQRPLSNSPNWEDVMKLPRRRFLQLTAGGLALSAISRMARAQVYPSKPLRWIIGFPAGGGADTVARIMEPWLSKRLGQPIIIENRPGASTNIAVQTVVNSPPDGYTLLWHGLSSVVNASLFVSLPFDIQRDIAPVAGVVSYPMIMVAHPSVPAQTVAELIAHAKANPGKVTMASFGTGSASHLAGELFKFMAGIDMVHIPYRGGAPMTTDLIGGQVNVGFDVMVTALPQVRSGKLRALGVLGRKRFDLLPDVATVAETLPGYEASTWAGIGVPRGTPPEIIERLSREVKEGLAQADIKARLADVGTVPMVLSPGEFRAYIAAEFEKWDKVVKVAGIKPD